MEKKYKSGILFGALISCAVLLSGCNNVGNNNVQSLEVQNKIVARHGLQGIDSLTNADVGINFRDVAYGNDIYMVVGSNGSIYTSSDTTLWTEQRGVTNVNLNAVAYNTKFKKFYAVGDTGKVFTSADGVAWIEYKTINKSVNLQSISVLPDGNEVIGGDQGFIFEVVFFDEEGKRNLVNPHNMKSKDGDENSFVTSIASGSSYLVSGSSTGSLNARLDDLDDSKGWEYTGSNNVSGVTDIFYNSQKSSFISLSKDGYINQTDAKVFKSSWSALSYTNYPSTENYNAGITANSVAVDHNSPYTFIVGGDKNNKDTNNKDTFIRYTKDISKWDSSNNIDYPKTGSLNKVRCFSGKPEPMCIAVGDKKAIVIIKIKDDEIKPEPIDITDPKIIAFIPKDGSVGVGINPLLDITFNKPVESVNNSNIKMYEEKVAPDTEVKLPIFRASENKDDYKFIPAHQLTKFTDYLVVVESGIHDAHGKRIVGETFHFKTGSTSYPEVKVVNPADGATGVSPSPNIDVTFSEPVEHVDTSNVKLHEGSATGGLIAITEPKSTDMINYLFAPKTNLKPRMQYCIVFGTGITNLDKVGLQTEHISCFTTGSTSSLSVNMIKPLDEEINVSIVPRLEFQFSKSVTGVNSENVTLHEDSADGPIVKIGNITESSDHISYSTFTSERLKLNTIYYIVFGAGIKEVGDPGNTLPITDFHFQTRPDDIVAIMPGNKCVYRYKLSGEIFCAKIPKNNAMLKGIYSKEYDRYITIGEGGDGVLGKGLTAWSDFVTGTKNNLRAIAILNPRKPVVVAVGDKGAIVVSDNMGDSWTVKTSPAGAKNLKNIYSDGDELFIAADGGDLLYSDDEGKTWKLKGDIVGLSTKGDQSVLNSNGKYHIIGSTSGIVYTSTDRMKSWEEQVQLTTLLDGKSVNQYLYDNDLGLNILFASWNKIFTATNEELSTGKWNKVAGFETGTRIDFTGASISADGALYMVGNEGTKAVGNPGSIYMSASGQHWIKVGTVTNDSFNSVVAIDK